MEMYLLLAEEFIPFLDTKGPPGSGDELSCCPKLYTLRYCKEEESSRHFKLLLGGNLFESKFIIVLIHFV